MLLVKRGESRRCSLQRRCTGTPLDFRSRSFFQLGPEFIFSWAPFRSPRRVRVPARLRCARRVPVRVAVPAGLCRPLRPGQRGVTSCGITIWQEGERLTRVPCCRLAHFLTPGLSPCFWGLVPDYRLQPEIRAFSSLLLATRDHRSFGFLESL